MYKILRTLLLMKRQFYYYLFLQIIFRTFMDALNSGESANTYSRMTYIFLWDLLYYDIIIANRHVLYH